MELDRRRSSPRVMSRNETIFLRATGLSKEEWIEQEICDHHLRPVDALKQYRHLLDEVVARHRRIAEEDEMRFRSATEAMRGAGS